MYMRSEKKGSGNFITKLPPMWPRDLLALSKLIESGDLAATISMGIT